MTTEEKKQAWERDQRRYNFIRIWQRRYNHMVARQNGSSTNASQAQGKEILEREEFFTWCKDSDNLMAFMSIYYDWMIDGFSLMLAPSIDRIDPAKGYTADNLQWLSFSDNCSKNNIDPTEYIYRSKR